MLGTTIAWSIDQPAHQHDDRRADDACSPDRKTSPSTRRSPAAPLPTRLAITFKAGQLPTMTIQEVIDSAVNALIRTKGVITASEYYRTVLHPRRHRRHRDLHLKRDFARLLDRQRRQGSRSLRNQSRHISGHASDQQPDGDQPDRRRRPPGRPERRCRGDERDRHASVSRRNRHDDADAREDARRRDRMRQRHRRVRASRGRLHDHDEVGLPQGAFHRSGRACLRPSP
ncbi:MAG: hypothetical protein MZU95_14265 [Desulfomicrobium escambiense]|nr:hypothetical protein [Desulfomicrobium escambiense]